MIRKILILFNFLVSCYFLYISSSSKYLILGEDQLPSEYVLLAAFFFFIFGFILYLLTRGKETKRWIKPAMIVALFLPYILLFGLGFLNIPSYVAHTLNWYSGHPGFPGTENYQLMIAKSIAAAILVPFLFSAFFWLSWSVNFLSLFLLRKK